MSTLELNDPDLSIVIPVTRMFGRLGNFRKMVETAEAFKIQLIIIHDKRDDATGPELQSILRNFKKVEFIEGVYGSAGAARNAGLSLVKSKWVGFWDSDDEPNVFECMALLEKIQIEKNLIGYGGFMKKSSRTNNTLVKSNLKFGNSAHEVVKNPGLWRWIFSTDHIKSLKFSNLWLGEDICFLFSVLQITDGITIIERDIYIYVVEDPLQSTQLLKNSSEIYLIVRYISQNFYHGQKNANLILGIFVKQLYSCLKRDKVRNKLFSLKVFIHSFFKMTLIEKVISIKWLLIIPLNSMDT